MSVIGVPMLLGPILGPVIGGLIVDNASWRWIFYVNVPIAFPRSCWPGSCSPPTRTCRRRPARLARPGAPLPRARAAIVFGLSESESHGGFGDPIVLVPVVAGLRDGRRVRAHALVRRRPLLDLRLFRDRAFSAAASTTFLLGGALFGALLVLPLYYQVARGESALTAAC